MQQRVLVASGLVSVVVDVLFAGRVHCEQHGVTSAGVAHVHGEPACVLHLHHRDPDRVVGNVDGCGLTHLHERVHHGAVGRHLGPGSVDVLDHHRVVTGRQLWEAERIEGGAAEQNDAAPASVIGGEEYGSRIVQNP